MPFTAFHPVPVWLLWMKFPRRFDFVALTVGAVIPDLLEPLFFLDLPHEVWSLQRDWTHSLLGAVTVDAVLALAATVLVARPLLAWADRRDPSGRWSRFGGLDIGTARPWPITLASVWVGSLSHVLVDLPFHATIRLLFPAPHEVLFPLELNLWATVVANLLFGIPFAYLLYRCWWKPSRSHVRANSRP